MKHIFALTLLAFTLHTGLTYSALVKSHDTSTLADDTSTDNTARNELTLARGLRFDWRVIFSGEFQRQLHDLLCSVSLSHRNRETIYTESLSLAQRSDVSVITLIDKLIAGTAINTVTDLNNFCKHLTTALTKEKIDHYTDYLIVLNGYEKKLREAAASNDLVTVKTLLQQGARVNSKNKNGESALYWAAKRGYSTIVELLLLQPGIDAIAADIRNNTAIDLARSEGHKDIVEMLTKHVDALRPKAKIEKKASCILI